MLSSSAPSFSLKSCPVIISCKFVTAVTHLEIHAPFYNLCQFPPTICHCGLLPFVKSPPILKCRMLNGPNITYIYCFIYSTNNYSIRLHLLRCCNSTTYDLNETANQLRHLFRCIVLFNANSRTYVFQCLQSNICVSMLTVEHMCFNGECSLRYPTVLCMSLIVRKLLISNGVVSVCWVKPLVTYR